MNSLTLEDIFGDEEDEEHFEEHIVLEPQFNPTKKICAILNDSGSRDEYFSLQGNFVDKITASYLINYLPKECADAYLSKSNALLKMVLVNIALGYSRTYSHDSNSILSKYPPRSSVEDLSIKIVNDIYHSMFNNLYYTRISETLEEDTEEYSEFEDTTNIYQNPVAQFLPENINLLLPTQAICELIGYSKRKLPVASNTSDLNLIIATNLYRNLMGHGKFKKSLDKHIRDNKYTARHTFILSILNFHHNFLDSYTKDKGGKK